MSDPSHSAAELEAHFIDLCDRFTAWAEPFRSIVTEHGGAPAAATPATPWSMKTFDCPSTALRHSGAAG